MLDLKALPAHYIEILGRDRVAEIVGVKPKIVSMWEKTGAYSVEAVQRLLEHDPTPLHRITPLYCNPEPGTKLAILIPLVGTPKGKMFDCFARLYDKHEMGFQRRAFNNLSVARNELAAWALARPFEWLLWMDADALVPCGDAAFFREASGIADASEAYAGMNAIFRLLVHKRKRGVEANIVSCSYVSRSENAVPQFGGGEAMRAEVKQGPRDVLKEVPWVGLHFCLTHRSVYEDIIKTQGDEIRMKQTPGAIGKKFNYEYCFFDPINRETPGDDIPFCIRAAKAGHKCYVDMAVQAVHIGDRGYSYKDV